MRNKIWVWFKCLWRRLVHYSSMPPTCWHVSVIYSEIHATKPTMEHLQTSWSDLICHCQLHTSRHMQSPLLHSEAFWWGCRYCGKQNQRVRHASWKNSSLRRTHHHKQNCFGSTTRRPSDDMHYSQQYCPLDLKKWKIEELKNSFIQVGCIKLIISNSILLR